MKRKGFIFVECILAVVIVSILAITMFPIINTSFKQVNSVKIKNELRNIAQSTIEILKSNDNLSSELLSELDLKDEVEVKADYISGGYKCVIYKINNSNNLIDIGVIAMYSNGEEVDRVELKASIRK